MKTWFAKWQISHALDERRPVPPAVTRAMEASPELQRFAVNADAVGRAFKNPQPSVEPTTTLHASIMRAVRAAQMGETRGAESFWPRWIPATALAALILFTIIGTRFSRPPAPISPASSPLAVAHSALATGGDWIQAAPAAALSPLSDEMTRLNRDWTNAQNYLLASLP